MMEVVNPVSFVRDYGETPAIAMHPSLYKLFAEAVAFFVTTISQGSDNTKELYTDIRREASQLGLSISQYLLLEEIVKDHLRQR